MVRIIFRRPLPLANYVVAIATALFLASCSKGPDVFNKPVSAADKKRPAATYPADVLDKWMTLQLRLMRNATGVPNQAFSRHFAYAGVTALEALTPGYTEHASWSQRWNGLTGMPAPDAGKRYYYPATVNAAMASINRSFFPAANPVDKAAIDSLEAALHAQFVATEPQPLIALSAKFGKDVASAVFSWSEGDGYKNASMPYTPPVGPGLWKPTPIALAPPSTPYWGSNRPIIFKSTDNTELPPPTSYSTDPSSPFYLMVKQVYDVSQQLTDDQKAMAFFWRDVPGATSPGHWLSILQQVIRQTGTTLDRAAVAYALTGVAINDALITCFKTKYQYNLVRPITYIREVMGYTSWNSLIGTPPHPEYSSAHAALSSAAGSTLEHLFGNIGSFTDHTYDFMNLPPRSYPSLYAIAEEAAMSRLYAGIHYQPSIQAGLGQGRIVTANIFNEIP